MLKRQNSICMVGRELNNKDFKEFFQIVADLGTLEECKKFFRDVSTISELSAMSERWQVAKMVNNGDSYRDISKKTGVSTATVTRVAHWLHHGMGGYKLVLERMKN